MYPGIGSEFRGHGTVNHSAEEYVRAHFWHTNTVENYFSILKRGIISIYYQVSEKHLFRYTAEFDFRHNHQCCSLWRVRGRNLPRLKVVAEMAGIPADLPAGVRLSDHISLGVIARTFPTERVRQVLAETGWASERKRDLPAQVMVYYAIALALYIGSSTREVLRCLLEGVRWLWGAKAVKVAGKSGISQARGRLGEAPLRRLYETMVQPIATCASRGA